MIACIQDAVDGSQAGFGLGDLKPRVQERRKDGFHSRLSLGTMEWIIQSPSCGWTALKQFQCRRTQCLGFYGRFPQ